MIPRSIVDAMSRQVGLVNRSENDAERVLASLAELGVSDHEQLKEFFLAYKLSGVLSKRETELVDLCSPTPQILETTEFGRDTFEVTDDFICLTSGEGDGFILYSKTSRKLFDVSVDELDAVESGERKADWESFYDLIKWYLP